MTTITTTRHPVKFYFGITMGFLAFTAMGQATGYTFLDKYFSGIIVRNECISGGEKINRKIGNIN